VYERIRGQAPPGDFCNCLRRTGNPTGALDSSQGRRSQPPSFSYVPRCLPCGSGDTRRAAQAPVRDDLGAGSSCLRRFARPRYRLDRATSSDLRRGSLVAIDVHGPLDRAKDVSSNARGRWPFVSSACAWRTPTTFPSSVSKEHPLSPARSTAREETLTEETDRPRPTFL